MKYLTLVIALSLGLLASPTILAKSCGSDCAKCYCRFSNGSTCSADHSILGTCTCTCVKKKKSTQSTESSTKKKGSSVPR